MSITRGGMIVKVYAMVGLSLLVGAASAGFLLYEVGAVSASYGVMLDNQARTTKEMDTARVLQVTFKKQVQAWKNILLRGADYDAYVKYADEFHETAKTGTDEARAIAASTVNPAVKELAEKLVAAHAELNTAYDKALKAFEQTRGTDFKAADAAVSGKDRAPTDLIDQLVAASAKSEDARLSAAKAAVARLQRLVALATMIGFGVVMALVVWQVRRIVAPLADSIDALRGNAMQVRSAAGQVAGSAQGLSQGATEQAAALEQTSASMEEMASMARKNAENTREAAGLMAQVDEQVSDSNQALSAMVTSMASITESSAKVAKIIKAIDEIAFQTNILALNAAVEAARAGEAGMGFAVVADEVRNLAQRSAQAARDTAGLIEESIERSNEGSGTVDRVARSITAITDSVIRVKGIVEEVREASMQQTSGIDQVSQAIAQMEKVTQSTAATAEESAAASEELDAQAETAMSVVRDLQVLVRGGSSEPAVAASTPSLEPQARRPTRREFVAFDRAA